MRFYNNKFASDILAKAKTYHIPGFEWQDIAQELDIILWQKLEKFEGRNGASLRTFATKVMRNKILDLNKAVNRYKRRADSYSKPFSELEEFEFEHVELALATPSLEESFYDYELTH